MRPVLSVLNARRAVVLALWVSGDHGCGRFGNYRVVHPGGIMKIYVSSTFDDLRDHRAAPDTALRRTGHDVIGMEHYVAEGTTPLERCLAGVRSCDIYVIIVA
jgi:Domain of unknown function (DUF4062)